MVHLFIFTIVCCGILLTVDVTFRARNRTIHEKNVCQFIHVVLDDRHFGSNRLLLLGFEENFSWKYSYV